MLSPQHQNVMVALFKRRNRFVPLKLSSRIFSFQAFVSTMEKSRHFRFVFCRVIFFLELVVKADWVIAGGWITFGEIHHPPFEIGKRRAVKSRLLRSLLGEKILCVLGVHEAEVAPDA